MLEYKYLKYKNKYVKKKNQNGGGAAALLDNARHLGNLIFDRIDGLANLFQVSNENENEKLLTCKHLEKFPKFFELSTLHFFDSFIEIPVTRNKKNFILGKLKSESILFSDCNTVLEKLYEYINSKPQNIIKCYYGDMASISEKLKIGSKMDGGSFGSIHYSAHGGIVKITPITKFTFLIFLIIFYNLLNSQNLIPTIYSLYYDDTSIYIHMEKYDMNLYSYHKNLLATLYANPQLSNSILNKIRNNSILVKKYNISYNHPPTRETLASILMHEIIEPKIKELLNGLYGLNLTCTDIKSLNMVVKHHDLYPIDVRLIDSEPDFCFCTYNIEFKLYIRANLHFLNIELQNKLSCEVISLQELTDDIYKYLSLVDKNNKKVGWSEYKNKIFKFKGNEEDYYNEYIKLSSSWTNRGDEFYESIGEYLDVLDPNDANYTIRENYKRRFKSISELFNTNMETLKNTYNDLVNLIKTGNYTELHIKDKLAIRETLNKREILKSMLYYMLFILIAFNPLNIIRYYCNNLFVYLFGHFQLFRVLRDEVTKIYTST
jgi:hypothetical protein